MKLSHNFARSAFLLCCLLGTNAASAQSTNQSFPTPISSTDVSGSIAARDVGDARLTTYYYAFDGAQGDIFVNLVTKNFAGDFDVFLVNGLKSLTRIVTFADMAESETGRVIYLRKPEKLLLRVQGRTPNDDPASFRIKFGGSFIALNPSAEELNLPEVKITDQAGIRVNSVGTIINDPVKVIRNVETPVSDKVELKTPVKKESAKIRKPLEVVVSEELSGKKDTKVKKETPAEARKKVRADAASTGSEKPKREDRAKLERPAKEAKPKPEKVIDPLENVRLVIQFKDGKTIERALNDVFRFSVDKGVLTVMTKDGGIRRFDMVNVSKVTIQ